MKVLRILAFEKVMPTVTCLVCQRKLSISIEQLAAVIQCPACQAEFNPSTGETAGARFVENPPEPPSVRRKHRPKLPETEEPESTEQPAWTTASAKPEPQEFGPCAEDSPEPWFYRFLEVYAKVSLWIGTIVIVGATVFSLIFLGIFVFTIPIILCGCIVGLLGLYGGIVYLLLCLDAARNLRELRQQQTEATGILGRTERRKSNRRSRK